MRLTRKYKPNWTDWLWLALSIIAIWALLEGVRLYVDPAPTLQMNLEES